MIFHGKKCNFPRQTFAFFAAFRGMAEVYIEGGKMNFY